MNYPYATFYLENQRAKRNLLHAFKAEPGGPLVGWFCRPLNTRPRKGKLLVDFLWRNCLGIRVNSFPT